MASSYDSRPSSPRPSSEWSAATGIQIDCGLQNDQARFMPSKCAADGYKSPGINSLQSAIRNPQSAILDPPIHDAFHDRQQFNGLEGFSDMNLEPGDQGAYAVFDASIGRKGYGRYLPAAIRIHLPHPAHQPVAVDGRHLDV